MADSGRSRRRRRNNRRKVQQIINATEIIVEESGECDNHAKETKEYHVESPKRVKSPEVKKPVKSRSLDDDDVVKIQELSEVSESEDKSECKAIISEAESDIEWEITATIDEPEIEVSTPISTTLSLDLEQCTAEQVSLISPEEELTLRNFLEGLNLVNSPEDAFRQVQLSTIDSVKMKRDHKRAVLEQYFSPMVQNPRFLDVINEETSDLSDREQSVTHHLKQGTPEPEVPPIRPSRKRKVLENPAILVGTKIIDIPMVSTVVPHARAEVVFLEDSSNSSTPDPKSEDEEKDTDDVLSSTNSSVPDLRESEVVEETKKTVITVKKNGVLICTNENVQGEKSFQKGEILTELTPPPTPDNPESVEIQVRTTLDEAKDEESLAQNQAQVREKNEEKRAKDKIVEVEIEKFAQDNAHVRSGRILDFSSFQKEDSEPEICKVEVTKVKLEDDSESARKEDEHTIFKKSPNADSVKESEKGDKSEEKIIKVNISRILSSEESPKNPEFSKETIIHVKLESEAEPVQGNDNVFKKSAKNHSVEESVQLKNPEEGIVNVQIANASPYLQTENKNVVSKETSRNTNTAIERIIEVKLEGDSKPVQKKNEDFVSEESSKNENISKERIIDVKLEDDSKSSQKKDEDFVSKELSESTNVSKERIIDVKLEGDSKSIQKKYESFASRESSKNTNVLKEIFTEVKLEGDSKSGQKKNEDFVSEESSKSANISKERIRDIKLEGDSKSFQKKDEKFVSKESSESTNVSKETKIHVKLGGDSKSIQKNGEDVKKVSKERIIDVKLESDSKPIQMKEDFVSKKSSESTNVFKEKIINVKLEGDSKPTLEKYEDFLSRESSKNEKISKETIIDVKLEGDSGDSRSVRTNDEDLISKKSGSTNVPKERIIDVKLESDSKSLQKDEHLVLKKLLKSHSVEESQKCESSKNRIIKVNLENNSSHLQKNQGDLFTTEVSKNLSPIELAKNSISKERIIEVKLEKDVQPPQKKQDVIDEIPKTKLESDSTSENTNPQASKETIIEVRLENNPPREKLVFGKSHSMDEYKTSEKILEVQVERDSRFAQNVDFGLKDVFKRPRSTKEKIIDVELDRESKSSRKENEFAQTVPKTQNSKERIIEVKIENGEKSVQNGDLKQKVVETATRFEQSENTIEKQLEVEVERVSKSKNVEIVRTPDVISSPEIIKLDDVKPPVVVVSAKPVTRNIHIDVEAEEKSSVFDTKVTQAENLESSMLKEASEDTSRLKSILQEETNKVHKHLESPSKQITIKLTESPSREVESICGVQVPESLFYTNVLSPPAPSPSPSLSSGSSRATSLCTAKYNPMNSSIADITSIKDDESFKGVKIESPLTLRQLCVDFLMSRPFGSDILQELADVSSSIEHLTNNLRENWIAQQDLLDFSPTPKSELDKGVCDGASKLLDVHEKFISGSYNAVDGQVEISAIKPRLLAIIRDAQEPKIMRISTLPRNMESARLKAKDLSEWLELARKDKNSQDGGGDGAAAHRRRSFPVDFYEQQMQHLREKEREIEKELEMLEEEKRRLGSPRRFREEDYRISKKGDYAESRKTRPVSMPVATEIFRQQMYDEYLDKMKEREERKQQKVLRVSQIDNVPTLKAPSGIEDEFMDMVKRKRELGKLNKIEDKTDEECETIPKHLREFMEIATGTESNAAGVWSPGQKQEPKPEQPRRSRSEIKNEPLSPVWTPKSATSSPTVERKEFRPVKFESPVLSRRNISRIEDEDSSDTSKEPPWRVPETSSDTGIILSSTLEKRLPTSHSSPASGFNDFPTTRLPKAQNPTITLLQKAREGQLPKGALYIEQDQSFKRTQNDRPTSHVGPGEILYKIRNEYTSESDSEKARKMADLGPRKFEGIGPTTKDGMPLILRSEVKDANQSKWYKKMYDTIHKQRPHRDEFVTVRYKQRRGQYPYTSGYLSEPEPGAYDSDFADYKYATLDRRRVVKDKENDYVSSTMPRSVEKVGSSLVKHGHDPYKNQPGRIENYIPGHSSISEKEAKEWWDEVMDIFDGHLEQQKRVPQTKSFINQALKESGYESDSTLVFRRRDDTAQQLSPTEQKEAYKTIQKGGDVPLYGLRKPAPERPKEPEPPLPPPKGHHGVRNLQPESPRKYVENEVTIHYKTPVRQEIKEYLSEDELAYRQAEAMKKIYQEERRRKYLQELQDMNNRRHTDNFIPSQKSPIPLNRYDDFDDLAPPVKPRPRSPEPRLLARALYNFVGQTARELTFRKGDLIYVRRQVDKNWYEGELNAMVGLFPVNYVEIVTYDTAKHTPRKSHEGQARAKYNFVAQTHLELSLAKGELVVITRRVDDNWFEGKIGGRKGIFPVSYVDVLIDPGDPQPPTSKPVAAPAAHSLLLNGSAGGKESMGSHSYTPNLSSNQLTSSYHAKPVQVTGYGSLSRGPKNPVGQALHIETQSEPVPYRALYKYLPQNDDELELLEGDTVYVLEKCDDGWYVGSSERTGAFGTFPGNYVEKI